jgi:uncharacterized protein DUF5906
VYHKFLKSEVLDVSRKLNSTARKKFSILVLSRLALPSAARYSLSRIKQMSKKSNPKKTDRVSSIYLAMLQLLAITPDHRKQLNNRGFDDTEIERLNYKTFPLSRNALVIRLADVFDNDLSGVPGFWQDERGTWQLAGKPGIIFPVYGIDGEISALKVRVDKPSVPSQKYLLLSSNPKADRVQGVQKYPGGTSAKATCHFPLDRPEKLDVLRITEGEIKADLTTLLSPQYTMAIPGVALWKMAIDAIKELQPAKVLLAWDSDKEEARNVEGITDRAYGGIRDAATYFGAELPKDSEDFFIGKTLASLYHSLKQEGINVAIESWDKEAGKGIDDVFCNGATDKLREWTAEESEEFVKLMLTSGVPGDWIYVVGVKSFYHTKTLIQLDKEQFSDRYAHEQSGNPAHNALTNSAFPKADLPIYLPEAAMTFSDEQGRRLFNLWRRNELEPREGSVAVFLAHMEYLIPEARERAVVLDWMAYNIQFPGKKIHWAVLLQGEQGTGKSYIGWVMRQLLGKNNVSSPTNEVIHEIYTAWQKSCQLVVVEEIMARGRMELMNKLKPIITQDITVVREMHKPAYEQPNCFNLLMFTNHEDSIIIDKTDRRYCVIFSPAKPRGDEYYAALWKETEGAAAAILYWMLKRDLSKFSPKGHAPMTGGKEALIEMSMPPLQSWMAECISHDTWPFQGDIVSAHHLLECLPTPLRNFASSQQLGRALKACGAIQLGQIKLDKGGSIRVWAVKRMTTWLALEAKDWLAEYQKWASASQPGGHGDSFNPMREARPM